MPVSPVPPDVEAVVLVFMTLMTSSAHSATSLKGSVLAAAVEVVAAEVAGAVHAAELPLKPRSFWICRKRLQAANASWKLNVVKSATPVAGREQSQAAIRSVVRRATGMARSFSHRVSFAFRRPVRHAGARARRSRIRVVTARAVADR
jgi:hypothetical protein